MDTKNYNIDSLEGSSKLPRLFLRNWNRKTANYVILVK